MWPFRKKLDTPLTGDDLVRLLGSIHAQVQLHQAEIERLSNQHASLRGYIYAKRGAVGPGSDPPPVLPAGRADKPLSRDELRILARQKGFNVGGLARVPPRPTEE